MASPEARACPDEKGTETQRITVREAGHPSDDVADNENKARVPQ